MRYKHVKHTEYALPTRSQTQPQLPSLPRVLVDLINQAVGTALWQKLTCEKPNQIIQCYEKHVCNLCIWHKLYLVTFVNKSRRW